MKNAYRWNAYGCLRAGWTGVALIALLGLPACSPMMDRMLGRETAPDESGLYVERTGAAGQPSWLRLDGSRQWEIETWAQRSDLDPGVVFIVRNPELAQAGGAPARFVRLRRVAWVRSAISARGDIMPADGGRWAVPDLDVFLVPLDVRMLEGRDDALRAAPLRPLEPGLYSLEFGAGAEPQRARLGVQWSSADERAYSATTCVDRYEGAGPRYRPCAEQVQGLQTAGLQWLKLYLVAPELRDSTEGQALVVKGVVVNTSEDEQTTVPTLEAQVRGPAGEVLERWHFDPGIAPLAPGGSASFRTEARRAPPGAHSVHVEFAPLGR